jgi:hypothetical protein
VAAPIPDIRKGACIAACKGEVMSTSLTKKALWLSLLVAANGAAGAQQVASEVGPADPLCGPTELSGQYECVVSVPLSEEEVRVSLAHLAASKSSKDGPPAPGAIDARKPVRHD